MRYNYVQSFLLATFKNLTNLALWVPYYDLDGALGRYGCSVTKHSPHRNSAITDACQMYDTPLLYLRGPLVINL